MATVDGLICTACVLAAATLVATQVYIPPHRQGKKEKSPAGAGFLAAVTNQKWQSHHSLKSLKKKCSCGAESCGLVVTWQNLKVSSIQNNSMIL